MSIRDLQTNQEPLNVQQLQLRFNEVATKLVDKTPGLPEALFDIHKNLLTNEHLVHLLSDEDIALLHSAHEKYKQFVLVQKETKKVGKAGKQKLGNLDELKL